MNREAYNLGSRNLNLSGFYLVNDQKKLYLHVGENVPGNECKLCSQRERDAASKKTRGTSSAISSSESYL